MHGKSLGVSEVRGQIVSGVKRWVKSCGHGSRWGSNHVDTGVAGGQRGSKHVEKGVAGGQIMVKACVGVSGGQSMWWSAGIKACGSRNWLGVKSGQSVDTGVAGVKSC